MQKLLSVVVSADQPWQGLRSATTPLSGVIGVAILGTLVGNQQTFLPGMHLAFALAGGVLLIGLISAWVFVRVIEYV